MLARTRSAALLLVLSALVTGCSGSDDDCGGRAYHPDLGQQGADTPIRALDAWLGDPEGFDHLPPDDDWIQVGDEESADRVVLTNEDGDGWWVTAARTEQGGYVVDQATDDWASCKDELS